MVLFCTHTPDNWSTRVYPYLLHGESEVGRSGRKKNKSPMSQRAPSSHPTIEKNLLKSIWCAFWVPYIVFLVMRVGLSILRLFFSRWWWASGGLRVVVVGVWWWVVVGCLWWWWW